MLLVLLPLDVHMCGTGKESCSLKRAAARGIYWMGVGCSDSSRGAGGQELKIVAAGAVKKAAAVGAAAAA